MKVIVCGAGQVGSQIARHLSDEGNAVTVVDSNAQAHATHQHCPDIQVLAQNLENRAADDERNHVGQHGQCPQAQ